MKLLAIDPGYERMGVAIIERDLPHKDRLIYSDCFKTKSSVPFYERLNDLGSEVERVIKKYQPEALAIEKLYLTNNQKTAMNVSEARGVIIYSASKKGLKIFEYTPPEIKVAVTGYGKADKMMVMNMVPKLIKIESPIKSDDEMDAIAIGLTCLACERFK